jgi:SpoVK/Ycf46/Vps4 family AAA+-type ATPase
MRGGPDDWTNVPIDGGDGGKNNVPVSTGGGQGNDATPNATLTYRADRPVSGVESVLEEEYGDVTPVPVLEEVHAQAGPFMQMGGATQQQVDPEYSVSEEYDEFPVNVALDVSEDIEVEIVQNTPDELGRLASISDELQDGEYLLTVEVHAEQKEYLGEVIETIEEAYGDTIQRYDPLEDQHDMMQQTQMEQMSQMAGGDVASMMGGDGDQFETDIDGYGWDDVYLEDDPMETVERLVVGPLVNPELYERAGEKPKGLFLYGDPGVGKTLLAKVVASETDATFLSASISELTNMFHGESSSQVDRLFDEAKEKSPSIIYIDEADSLLRPRGGAGASPTTDQIREDMVNTFLDNMDGLEELQDVMVIASTNRMDAIDDASKRKGRFDAIEEIPPPTEEGREEIYRIHTVDRNDEVFVDLDFDELAERTEGETGADIAGSVKTARTNVIQDLKEEYGGYADIPPEEFVVEHEDILRAIEEQEEDDAPGGRIGFQ